MNKRSVTELMSVAKAIYEEGAPGAGTASMPAGTTPAGTAAMFATTTPAPP